MVVVVVVVVVVVASAAKTSLICIKCSLLEMLIFTHRFDLLNKVFVWKGQIYNVSIFFNLSVKKLVKL